MLWMEDEGMTTLQTLHRQRIIADKRLCYAPPKLTLATSFIRRTLYKIPNPAKCINEETFNKTIRSDGRNGTNFHT